MGLESCVWDGGAVFGFDHNGIPRRDLAAVKLEVYLPQGPFWATLERPSWECW